MDQKLRWAIEVLILSTGIYLFLRFLRATRGGGVMRGLVVAFVFGVLGLLGLAKLLLLEELNHIIRSVIPSLAVILTILFQPELRRAIARLGEHDRIGRLLGRRRGGAIHEVVQAVIDMAARRQGALIAFQRETPIEPYVQNAVHIDAEVRKDLIESIFYPGGALHDGGMLIDNDRIAAAACIFPLTESPDLAKSMGTRHRAGLGLSEETDAVALIVSEETGAISVCHRGHMDRHVAPERLESLLLERLGYGAHQDGEAAEEPSGRGWSTWRELPRLVLTTFTRDVSNKLGALALAGLMVYAANQRITVDQTVPLQVFASRPSASAVLPRLALEVRLPGDDWRLMSPTSGQRVDIQVSGTRAEVDRALETLRGVLTVPASLPAAGVEFPLRDVVWATGGRGELEVAVQWKSEPPHLRIERFDQTRVPLEPKQLRLDASAIDPRLQVLLDQVDFQPNSILLRGPAGKIERLRGGELALELAPIVLVAEDRLQRTVPLQLAEELVAEGLEIVQGASAVIDLSPAERSLGTIEKDIQVIVEASADGQAPEVRWTVNEYEQRARFRIRTAGIVPASAEPGQQAYDEIARTVREYVEENLDAVVRVRDLIEEGGSTVPIRYFWPPPKWRSELAGRLGVRLDRFAELEVILESEARVRILRSEPR